MCASVKVSAGQVSQASWTMQCKSFHFRFCVARLHTDSKQKQPQHARRQAYRHIKVVTHVTGSLVVRVEADTLVVLSCGHGALPLSVCVVGAESWLGALRRSLFGAVLLVGGRRGVGGGGERCDGRGHREGRGGEGGSRGSKGKPGLTLPLLGGKHRTPQRRPNARGRGKEGTKEWKGRTAGRAGRIPTGRQRAPPTHACKVTFNEGYPKVTVIKVTPASISQSPRPGPCQARTAHNFMCEAKCQLS